MQFLPPPLGRMTGERGGTNFYKCSKASWAPLLTLTAVLVRYTRGSNRATSQGLSNVALLCQFTYICVFNLGVLYLVPVRLYMAAI